MVRTHNLFEFVNLFVTIIFTLGQLWIKDYACFAKILSSLSSSFWVFLIYSSVYELRLKLLKASFFVYSWYIFLLNYHTKIRADTPVVTQKFNSFQWSCFKGIVYYKRFKTLIQTCQLKIFKTMIFWIFLWIFLYSKYLILYLTKIDVEHVQKCMFNTNPFGEKS